MKGNVQFALISLRLNDSWWNGTLSSLTFSLGSVETTCLRSSSQAGAPTLSQIAMLQQLTAPPHRHHNGGARTLMCFFRFLVISLLTSAPIAPLTAQTKQQIKQLPRGCAYMSVGTFLPCPARKDGINMTRVVAPPQFLIGLAEAHERGDFTRE